MNCSLKKLKPFIIGIFFLVFFYSCYSEDNSGGFEITFPVNKIVYADLSNSSNFFILSSRNSNNLSDSIIFGEILLSSNNLFNNKYMYLINEFIDMVNLKAEEGIELLTINVSRSILIFEYADGTSIHWKYFLKELPLLK